MATANDQMDAVLLLDKGFSNLTVGKAAKPEAGAGQALIKIEYTALNPVDWKMAESVRRTVACVKTHMLTLSGVSAGTAS